MTEEEARAILESRSAAAVDPALETQEIDDILAASVTEDGWDLDAAEASAWDRKAAKAANRTLYLQDGRATADKLLFDNCVRMAELARRRVAESMAIVEIEF